METAPEAMWCNHWAPVAIFYLFMCLLGDRRMHPSQAPQVEPRGGFEGLGYQEVVCKRIRWLLNSSRRYSIIFVGILSKFFMVSHQLRYFLAVMMSSGDPVSPRYAQLTS